MTVEDEILITQVQLDKWDPARHALADNERCLDFGSDIKFESFRPRFGQEFASDFLFMEWDKIRRGFYPQRAARKDYASADSPLTVKQRKFIDGKLNGKSSAEAAKDAGYARSVQRRADAIITASPSVLGAIEELLASVGVSDELRCLRLS